MKLTKEQLIVENAQLRERVHQLSITCKQLVGNLNRVKRGEAPSKRRAEMLAAKAQAMRSGVTTLARQGELHV